MSQNEFKNEVLTDSLDVQEEPSPDVNINLILIDSFSKFKGGAEALSLYLQYYYLGRRNETNQPWAEVRYMAKRMHWGRDKVQKYKKLLVQRGYISDVIRRDKAGKIVKKYVKVKWMRKESTVKAHLERYGDNTEWLDNDQSGCNGGINCSITHPPENQLHGDVNHTPENTVDRKTDTNALSSITIKTLSSIKKKAAPEKPKKRLSLSQKWSVDASGERYYIDKTTNRPVYARDVEEEPIKEVRVVSSSDSFYPVEHVLNRSDPTREEVLSILESMKKIGGTQAKGMLPHLQPILSKALAVFNSKCPEPTITFDNWSAFYSQIFSKFSTCKVHSRKWNGLEHKVKTGVVVSTFFEYMMKYMSALSGFDEEAKSIPKYLENCETKNGDFLIDNVNGRMNKLIETGFTSEKHMRALKQFDAKGTLRGFKYANKSDITPSVLNMQVIDDRRAGIDQCSPFQRSSRS